MRKDAFEVEAAELAGASPSPAIALFLGAYENKLVSEIKAGENRGKSLPLLPKAVPGHSGVVAFVQNRATGEVLQALMLPACPS